MAGNFTREQLNKVDHDFLVELLLSQQAQLSSQTETINAMAAELKRLSDQITLANKSRFGRSSEKLMDPNQYTFKFLEDGTVIFFNEAEAVAELEQAAEPETLDPAEKAPKKKAKKVGNKQEVISTLPRVSVDHYLSDAELETHFGKDGWKRLPDQVMLNYVFIPAEIKVEEHHIGVYAAKHDDTKIIKAPHPKQLLRGSLVSASIAASIINAKYVNAVPLYRQEQEFERYGLTIPRQNMANWMIRLGESYFGILYDYLHEKLYNYPVIQADETPVLVNKDGREAGSKSYMWVYRSGYLYRDKQIVLYEYQKTRNASHPREFLKNYAGVCVTDGYQVYHTLEKEKEDLTIAGCWVHMRRRWEEVLETIPKKDQKKSTTYLIMKHIQAIYREEGKLKDLSSSERLQQRQRIIMPMVDAFFAYLKQNKDKFVKTEKVQEALNYALNQEKHLRVFLSNGDVPIDNNASERAIRGFCIGKKNWHMIDTVLGAKSSAIIYSIAETAKANNLKPYDYFKYLLEVLPEHLDDKDRSFLEKLLPWSPDLPSNIRKPVK
ncbi:MAG: IS66 family transposase [Eubacteriales bacterium]|nr:IS66 family transposase [Eubacteriales bacterium]